MLFCHEIGSASLIRQGGCGEATETLLARFACKEVLLLEPLLEVGGFVHVKSQNGASLEMSY